MQAWQLPEMQTNGELHCEPSEQDPHTPATHTCPEAQSPFPVQAPQLPPTHA
jgi:hypothetical protein